MGHDDEWWYVDPGQGWLVVMRAEEVETRDDLVRFLLEMSNEVESFQNQELAVFLEAASAWLADMDGYFLNRGEEVPGSPDWSLLACVLAAATVYD